MHSRWQSKAIDRCAPPQLGMLITCRRRCPPIQGIPISSCELGVAPSVFEAEWFVKQLQNTFQKPPGALVLRVGQALIGRALFDEHATVDKDYPVGHLAREAHLVCD